MTMKSFQIAIGNFVSFELVTVLRRLSRLILVKKNKIKVSFKCSSSKL